MERRGSAFEQNAFEIFSGKHFGEGNFSKVKLEG